MSMTNDKCQTQVHFPRGGGVLLGILQPLGSPLSQRPLPVSAG